LLDLDHIRYTKPWPRYPDRRIVANVQLNPSGDAALQRLIDTYKIPEGAGRSPK
jgi:hypothetical protein